jgi:hypothetical protein
MVVPALAGRRRSCSARRSHSPPRRTWSEVATRSGYNRLRKPFIRGCVGKQDNGGAQSAGTCMRLAARPAAVGGVSPPMQQSSQPEQNDAGRRTNACSRRRKRGDFTCIRHVSAFPLVNPFARPPRLMLTVRQPGSVGGRPFLLVFGHRARPHRARLNPYRSYRSPPARRSRSPPRLNLVERNHRSGYNQLRKPNRRGCVRKHDNGGARGART